jgi:hypothetical protein
VICPAKSSVASCLEPLPLEHGHNNVHMIGAGKMWRRQQIAKVILGACRQDKISLVACVLAYTFLGQFVPSDTRNAPPDSHITIDSISHGIFKRFLLSQRQRAYRHKISIPRLITLNAFLTSVSFITVSFNSYLVPLYGFGIRK